MPRTKAPWNSSWRRGEPAIAAIAARLESLRRELLEAGARGLSKAGQIIIADAQENYVPVRDGILQSSGHVDEPIITSDNAEVHIGFGGAADAYALVQHERMDYHHEIGGPKYLERPVLAHAADIKECVAEEMRGVMSGNGEGATNDE